MLLAVGLVLTSSAAAAPVLLTDMTIHRNGTVAMHTLEIVNGTTKLPSFEGDYSIGLYNETGAALFERSFAVDFSYVFFPPGPDATEPETDSVRRMYRLPLSPEVDRLQVGRAGVDLYDAQLRPAVCPSDIAPTYCDPGQDRTDDGDGVLRPLLLVGLLGLLAVLLVLKFRSDGDEQDDGPEQRFY